MSRERALWAAVALNAMQEHASAIATARGKQRSHRFGNIATTVGSLEFETARAQRYFESKDWDDVSTRAGLTVTPSQVMLAVTSGRVLRPDDDRRLACWRGAVEAIGGDPDELDAECIAAPVRTAQDGRKAVAATSGRENSQRALSRQEKGQACRAKQ